MDPTLEQWKEISDTVKKHKLVPFFDSAYQVSVKQGYAVRIFKEIASDTLVLVFVID
jgi:aspartate/tyrosine/aromatic aminotransferase